MKRLLPTFIFLQMLALTAWGQITINIEPATFTLTGNPSSNDVSMHIEITNQSGIDAYILWSRVVESPPQGWLTWICDKNLCYIPTANACAPNKPNILAPGEKLDLQIHVNPGSVEGSTPYDITLLDYEDPNVVLGQIHGEVIISNTVSTKNNNPLSNLTVFPNPTTDYFQVTDIPGLKYIELYNIVGNKMKSFDAVPQKQYFVGEMADGIYLVRLVSNTGKVLKTVRLSKR